MQTERILKLTFCSGAGTVTGANFLLEGNGKKFLVDCGLIQGEKFLDDLNWVPFPYDASEIDILFITHSHADHIGRIPKLIHEGFNGRIISTIPTKEISAIMLADTANILINEDEKGENNIKEIYSQENIKKMSELWETIDYGEKLNVDHGFQFSFKDAGHILGSGMLEVLYNGKKLVFTGDLGNSPSPLLPDTEVISDADYMVMESCYGDKNHEDRKIRRKELEDVIKSNYQNGGVLILPTFSLERTQELLYEINSLVENNIVPQMPIFLDSPLSIRLTDVYMKYDRYFNETARNIIKKGDNLFDFPGLRRTPNTEDSKGILEVPSPKIVIAGSGMSNGGRILHHEKNYLPDKRNTILLTGYQSAGTMGRLIQDGAKKIRIMGEDVPVRAQVAFISAYSGHKDSDHLIEFVGNTAKTLKKVFAVMGEPKSAMFLAQKINDNFGVKSYAPNSSESFTLEF